MGLIVADPTVKNKWWGTQTQFSQLETSRIGKILGAAGATAGGITALCAAGIVTAPCALPTGAAAIAAALWAGVNLCNWNNNGFNLNQTHTGHSWCTAR